MTLNIVSTMILGILTTSLSIWWVRTTLKEGNRALKDSQTKN